MSYNYNFATRVMYTCVFRGGVNSKLILTKSVGMSDVLSPHSQFSEFFQCPVLFYIEFTSFDVTFSSNQKKESGIMLH